MKSHYDPIQVETDTDGLPRSFRWRNRAWPILAVSDRWVIQSGWWRQGGTERRDYLLVQAAGMDGASCTVELFLRGHGSGTAGEWVLARMM